MAVKSQAPITLYRGFATTNTHVWSPFVNKLETRFRLAGITYRVDVGGPRQGPRGKIPYIAYGEGGELIGDTALITRRLVSDGIVTDLNAQLSPAEKAIDLSVRSLCEDKMSFLMARERWVDNYYLMRDGALAALPWLVRCVVGNLVYRKVTGALYGQGTGRYTDEEVREMRRGVWEALSDLLAERRKVVRDREAPFWVLGREEPTEADATVYALVATGLVCTAAPDTQKIVREFPVLVDYARRIHGKYFGDYDIWEEQV
ncbi:hypothetical protein B0H63DRAFT_488870 [Podospora didyma]|uniref:Thioredoxin-like fold domain-containing protein n=1 Tax=Podospora didyma TaxID=330526 RepID=A0AAE0K244_9PEZI|nr:hypothetical protein B0H63DRAFT_488870 [Podospora didyma]